MRSLLVFACTSIATCSQFLANDAPGQCLLGVPGKTAQEQCNFLLGFVKDGNRTRLSLAQEPAQVGVSDEPLPWAVPGTPPTEADECQEPPHPQVDETGFFLN